MARSAVLLSLAVGCQAWGPDGHMIVAHVADKLLDPKVHQILLQDLGSTSLSSAATWCDDFDHSPIGKWSEPLHFINYPGHSCDFDWARDCKDDMCNVGALLNYSGQVFDRGTSADARLVALKFVIHMMGDVHQPLHVGSADDKGGNAIKVETHFEPGLTSGGLQGHHGGENLHKVWDSTLVKQIISEMKEARDAAATTSQELLSSHHHHHQKAGIGAGGEEDWQLLSNELWRRLEGVWSTNLTQWRKVMAQGSGDDALLVAGPPATSGGAAAGLEAHRDEMLLRAGLSFVAGRTASLSCSSAYVTSDGHRIQSGETLGRDYFEWAKPVVEMQLAKAGARLAQILSDSLELSGMAEVFMV